MKKSVIKNCLIVLGFIIIASGDVFIQELSNLDEVWIYNFARCIHDGLLPYKEFSMIITPLFPMICSVFLHIFGNEMVVLRFLEVVEIAVILFMIYKVLTRLKLNKYLSLIILLRNILYSF